MTLTIDQIKDLQAQTDALEREGIERAHVDIDPLRQVLAMAEAFAEVLKEDGLQIGHKTFSTRVGDIVKKFRLKDG